MLLAGSSRRNTTLSKNISTDDSSCNNEPDVPSQASSGLRVSSGSHSGTRKSSKLDIPENSRRRDEANFQQCRKEPWKVPEDKEACAGSKLQSCKESALVDQGNQAASMSESGEHMVGTREERLCSINGKPLSSDKVDDKRTLNKRGSNWDFDI